MLHSSSTHVHTGTTVVFLLVNNLLFTINIRVNAFLSKEKERGGGGEH